VRLLMAAGTILLLMTAAHSQPYALHRPTVPAAFIPAGDDDSGSSGDASAADNTDDVSTATGDVGPAGDGGGDRSPAAAVAGATNNSAGAPRPRQRPVRKPRAMPPTSPQRWNLSH
jgi:hypothetical protein